MLGSELNDDPNVPRQAYAPIFPSENFITHVSKENTVYTSVTYHYHAQPFHILFRNHGTSPGGATIGQMTSPTGFEYINAGKWKARGDHLLTLLSTATAVMGVLIDADL